MEVPSRPGEQAKDRHHVAAQRWATASSEAASASWHPWERRREIECSAGEEKKKSHWSDSDNDRIIDLH